MPNAGYAFKSIENVSTVVITNGNHSRIAIRKFKLLHREWIVKLPFRAKMLECRPIGDSNFASFREIFFVRGHYRLANALVQLHAHYHHCGEAASEKCLSAATFVS